MSKRVKQTWLDFVETYREARLLWDPQDEHRTSKALRAEAHEKLLKKYKKIDENADMADMKNRLANMRTTFNRERKKVMESIQNGDRFVHQPTLWYFDIFNSFLDLDTDGMSLDMLKNFKHTIPVTRSSKSERECFRTDIHNASTKGEEDEEDSETQPRHKRQRIYNLLQKQERFVDTASKILHHKENEWEINGKAIGLQLYQLDTTQRFIAQKLISDTLFLGRLGNLTEESIIQLSNRQASPEMHEEIDYLEEELEDDDDVAIINGDD